MSARAGADGVLASSFRDPSGFLFERDGVLLRHVSPRYREDYEALRGSGLYERLVERGLLLPWDEEPPRPEDGDAYKVLRPRRLPFVSYPYEWSFSQLRDAALATLAIQRRALEAGLWLKDASAYNVQLLAGRPVLIDSLSFERLRPGEPWPAYRQLCQHFLAPLALMAHRDVRLQQLLRVHLDGVPLDLAARLLPLRARLRPALLVHLVFHARAQRRYAAAPATAARRRGVSLQALRGLVDHLERAVRGLRWRPRGTEWADYYEKIHYGEEALERKRELVGELLERVAPSTVWDLGANTGLFSRLAAERGAFVVAFDLDPAAVERAYLEVRREREERLLPLLLDLTNPSPNLGWANRERSTLEERGPADLVMALALVHHLAIGNNVPLPEIADWLARLGRHAIVEWVPKEDPMVRRLLAHREDVFPGYTPEGFETAFGRHFEVQAREALPGTSRTLCLLRRR